MKKPFVLLLRIFFMFIFVFSFDASVAFPYSVTLSWNAPTKNANGTPLTDLAGYYIYYGSEPRNYEFKINAGNRTEYTVSDLTRDVGYTQIHLSQGDGYYGWAEYAPFKAIIVTAAPDHLPPPLAEQLAEGGRLVIPIGPPGGYQSLWKFSQGKRGTESLQHGRRQVCTLHRGGSESEHPTCTLARDP